MRIGAHVRQDDDPIGQGERLGADLVQLFLSDPQKWDTPGEHPKKDQILASDIDVVVHSPYVVNVASLNNRLRMPSRKAVADHAEAASRISEEFRPGNPRRMTDDQVAEKLKKIRELYEITQETIEKYEQG